MYLSAIGRCFSLLLQLKSSSQGISYTCAIDASVALGAAVAVELLKQLCDAGVPDWWKGSHKTLAEFESFNQESTILTASASPQIFGSL